MFGRAKESRTINFVRIGKNKSGENKKRYKVEREFPAGVFCEKIKESNRILSTEYVDLVTLNRNGDVAVIELKFDDSRLEVIPQVLNYALFFIRIDPSSRRYWINDLTVLQKVLSS